MLAGCRPPTPFEPLGLSGRRRSLHLTFSCINRRIWICKPKVAGSIPAGGTKKTKKAKKTITISDRWQFQRRFAVPCCSTLQRIPRISGVFNVLQWSPCNTDATRRQEDGQPIKGIGIRGLGAAGDKLVILTGDAGVNGNMAALDVSRKPENGCPDLMASDPPYPNREATLAPIIWVGTLELPRRSRLPFW